VSPTTAEHVRSELGSDVELILDGGASQVGVESTIVDVSGPSPRLLRPGGIAREAIERVLGVPLQLATHATDVRAPGMLESHYAPRAGLWLVSSDALVAEAAKHAGARLVIIAPASAPRVPGAVHLDVPADAEGFARVLYAKLREADGVGELIFAVPPPESGLGLAVRDRLQRAAAPRK
jgi:L-threonylcarbamoyladenylate synthase